MVAGPAACDKRSRRDGGCTATIAPAFARSSTATPRARRPAGPPERSALHAPPGCLGHHSPCSSPLCVLHLKNKQSASPIHSTQQTNKQAYQYTFSLEILLPLAECKSLGKHHLLSPSYELHSSRSSIFSSLFLHQRNTSGSSSLRSNF